MESFKSSFSIPEIIRKKRDKTELSEEEIKFLISRIIAPSEVDRMHDSQIGAFLMATYLNGLTHSETTALVKAMTYSGFTFEWPKAWKGLVVDKHSTGGVGDKVSLILAPALAACGLKVPMISGRGLDFTGGTLDKLEAIPGFSVSLSKERMLEVLETVGCCIVGQTSDVAPADKLLYSIRDTTATVDNEDLIVASIISKKAAEKLDSLVMDVKTGRGALMKKPEDAKKLATKLVKAGNMFGMKVTAFITNMDSPLGKAIGNALEVAEAIDCLGGKGPSDLLEIVSTLGGKLLHSIERVSSLQEGQKMITKTLVDGTALKKFRDMVTNQGAELNVANEICYGDKWKYLPKSINIIFVKSPNSGYVSDIDALEIAKLCHSLGCGRTDPASCIKYEPGIMLVKKPGDKVLTGETLLEVHLPHGSSALPFSESVLTNSFRITSEFQPQRLILESVD